jgi:hypothetical protein
MKPINNFLFRVEKSRALQWIQGNEFWSGISINVSICTVLIEIDLFKKGEWHPNHRSRLKLNMLHLFFFDDRNYKLSLFRWRLLIQINLKRFYWNGQKVNLMESALSGRILNFPIPNDANNKWVSIRISEAGLKGWTHTRECFTLILWFFE